MVRNSRSTFSPFRFALQKIPDGQDMRMIMAVPGYEFFYWSKPSYAQIRFLSIHFWSSNLFIVLPLIGMKSNFSFSNFCGNPKIINPCLSNPAMVLEFQILCFVAASDYDSIFILESDVLITLFIETIYGYIPHCQ